MAKKTTKKSQKQAFPKESRLEAFSSFVIEWMGSNTSLVVHTILFVLCFWLVLLWVSMDKMLAILTNVVSLEAIYLAIFIQMSVNKNTKSLKEVEKDIDEIEKDVDSIEKNIDEIQEDVDELQEDVEDIQENVEEDELEETEELKRERGRDERIDRVVGSLDLIQNQLNVLFDEMKKAKKTNHDEK